MRTVIFTILIISNFTYSQWLPQNSNITSEVNSLYFININTGWAVGGNGKILYTNNGGDVWQQQNSTTNHLLNSVHFVNELTGYITGTFEVNFTFRLNVVLKTTNSGNVWDTINYFVSFNNIKTNSSVSFFNNSTGLVTRMGSDGFSSQGELLKTINSGATWSQVFFPVYISFYKAESLNSTTAFLLGKYFTDVPGFDTTYVFKTTDLGNTWSEVYHVNNIGIQNISAANNNIILTGYTAGTNSVGIIIKSTDLGASWSSASNTPIPPLRNSFFINNFTGWAIGSSGIIIFTTNNGANWSTQQQNQTYSLNDIQMFSPCTGWTVGSTGKILKTTNCGVIAISNISTEIPETYSLSQNYPNPFNPVTTIRFAIPSNVKSEMSNVKIIIYDVLGREVQTLVDENISPGTYEVDFDGSNLPSGVYYYKLEVSDPSTPLRVTETKKMVLLK